ncbi:MAG: KUP/HAK/KT family potassium transporter [Proteobacteria bacterium]|nr:KUP/HAK/KT family potassium transporter [Pseudomonadota bacterium]
MKLSDSTQCSSKKEQIIHDIKGIIKSLGLVFGDIGTSPIYTLTVIFILLKPTYDNVIGVLSLIVWTLTILVSVEYGWLAMSLGEKGEGGTIVLRSILLRYLKKSRQAVFITILTFIGISLLVGDGVITPAISILSAVEGILLIPGFKETKQMTLIIVASFIAFLLFIFQKKGTEKVAGAFGPLMLIWFFSIGISGIISIIHVPSVWKAINPYYAFKFLYQNGLAGFFVLSEVILCATGGEALYADMGHLGRKPIIRAWYFVFIALLLNYLGQGAFIIEHPGSVWNVLFGMVLHESTIFYIPFLILSIIATVIASQALISGMFSIVYQGINTRLMPMFKVEYTSTEMRSQIYIGFVNWFLLVSVLFIVFLFKESNKLAAAYGLAVTGTMTLTGIMMTMIFYSRREKIKTLLAVLVTFADLTFLVSNTYKLPNGGYWSLIIAAIPLSIILIYTAGQRKLYRSVRPLKLDIFLESYNQLYHELNKIKGTALFFARDAKKVPDYIVHTIFMNNIIYEDNIIVSIVTKDEPFGVNGHFKEKLADGLRVFEIQMGYMEVVDIEEILKKAGIVEKSIFYGLEEIATHNIIWKIFSVFKRLAPPFVQFHDLPHNKLHGVVTRIEL